MREVTSPASMRIISGAKVESVPPWKLDGFKDLSPGGICELGYGDQNKTRKTLQYLSNIKHREKYRSYLGWGVAFVPWLLNATPEVLYDGNGRTPLRDIPMRVRIVLKRRLAKISDRQIGFLLSVIPLYNNARRIKNAIWIGGGFDPSGHTMFKMAQYGLMLSIATDHGSNTSISMPIIGYIAIMVVADSLMLANTFTNCHTSAEVVVGAALGAATLIAAQVISRYTPLGRWVRRSANAICEIVRGASSNRVLLA